MASPNFDFPDGTSPPRPSSRKLMTYSKSNVRRTPNEPVTRPLFSATKTLSANSSEPPGSTAPAPVAPRKTLVKPASWALSSPKSSVPSNSVGPKRDTGKGIDEEDSIRKRTYTQAFVAKRPKKEKYEKHTANKRSAAIPTKLPKQVRREEAPPAKAGIPRLPSRAERAGSQSRTIVSPSKRPIVSLSRSSSPTSHPVDKAETPPRPRAVENLAKDRRPRLIDALVAQRVASPDSEPSDSDLDVVGSKTQHIKAQDAFNTQSPRPTISRNVRSGQRIGETANRKKVKYTYSQTRTIKDNPRPSEPPLPFEASEMESGGLLADPLGISGSGSFDFDEDEDDDTSSKVAIKSVHELRRAGANNRFADEMEDLLSRIGEPTITPSSMRRNALFDLAQRLQRADFAGNFRDHSTRDNAFKYVGQEEDVIAGFALIASLVIFLTSGSAPHLLQQLTDEGIGTALGRFLCVDDDIDAIAARRQSNLIKSSRATLHLIKESLRKHEIWHGHAVTEMPPRLLALQLLDVLTRSADAHSVATITKESDEGLFTLANDFVDPDLEEGAELALIVSVLEGQSSLSVGADEAISDTSRWSLPTASFLERTLRKWPEHTTSTGTTVLKLAINTTNTAGGAKAFDRSGLLSQLSRSVCAGFSRVQTDVVSGGIDTDLYNGLLLILGVGINIFEHCPAARKSLDEVSQANLVELYAKNHASMSEADSEEKSKLSVAFGYLAVLLGYLCLAPPVRKRFQSEERGLRDLIKSIQEFITMFKHAGNKANELETLVTNLRTGSWVL